MNKSSYSHPQIRFKSHLTFAWYSPPKLHQMKRNFLYITLVSLFLLLPTIMFAPPIPPGPGGSTPAAPIDAGLGFLLVAGAAYGIQKVAKRKVS